MEPIYCPNRLELDRRVSIQGCRLARRLYCVVSGLFAAISYAITHRLERGGDEFPLENCWPKPGVAAWRSARSAHDRRRGSPPFFLNGKECGGWPLLSPL